MLTERVEHAAVLSRRCDGLNVPFTSNHVISGVIHQPTLSYHKVGEFETTENIKGCSVIIPQAASFCL